MPQTAQERQLCTTPVSVSASQSSWNKSAFYRRLVCLDKDVGKYLVRLSLSSDFIWMKSSTIFGIKWLNVISAQFVSIKSSHNTLAGFHSNQTQWEWWEDSHRLHHFFTRLPLSASKNNVFLHRLPFLSMTDVSSVCFNGDVKANYFLSMLHFYSRGKGLLVSYPCFFFL